MRRDKSEVNFESDIDEFIRLAQRWNTLHNRLLNTLARLPQEVYQFTVQKISFHAGQSQTIQVKEIKKPYMIILKRTDSESLIAHEIAHAYLNHTKTNTMSDDQEVEADELRKNWGFKKKQLCHLFLKAVLIVLILTVLKANQENIIKNFPKNSGRSEKMQVLFCKT